MDPSQSLHHRTMNWDQRHSQQSQQIRIGMLALLLVAAILMLANLGGLSLSVDEFVNVLIERQTWSEMMTSLQLGADLHPPVTHVIMNVWMRLVGESEWTVRFPWGVAGILNVALTFRLAAMLFSDRIGVISALLLLSAPTYLLYMRFEKYYALTITLSLLFLIASVALWKSPSRWNLAKYVLTLTALLYTDYLAPLFLVLSLNVALLLLGRQRRRLVAFLGGQAISAVLFVPWLAIMLAQASILKGGAPADLGRSGLGMLIAILYWPFSIGVGETVFPWQISGIVGTLIVAIFAIAGAIVCIKRKSSNSGRAGPILLLTLALSLASAAWLTSWIFASVPFIAFPNHTLFLAPLFAMLLAIGAVALPKYGSMTLLTLLLVARLIGVSNYFTATNYHNPIYAVPMREITTSLLSDTSAEDAWVANTDVGLHYYFERLTVDSRGTTPELILLDNIRRAFGQMEAKMPERVWLFQFGRDRTAVVTAESEMEQWLLTHGYALKQEQGYAEQDERYRRVKELLFKRPAYQYKLVVKEYVRRVE